jgi:dephospho-CoA kinase
MDGCYPAVTSSGSESAPGGHYCPVVLRIGLTGGIGSGKSTVSALLAERGAVIVDADRIAREVVAPGTPGLAQVVDAFGKEVLAADGSLDRQALAAIVFTDPQARARLDGIVHPLVRARSAELVAAVPEDSVVVNDVPLLVETGQAGSYDLVLVVEADPATRVSRLVRRGLTAEDARARMAAQASDEQRRAMADVVLDNSGTPEELAEQVDRFWGERVAPPR